MARRSPLLGAMAHPRYVLPDQTYLITRRCYQRTFRLQPQDETNQIFAYCLALAMAKTGVRLHAACVMSNHHHLVVTDPHGVLPEFLRELHRLTAKAVNASQGQWENLWSAEPCNAVRLVTDEDIEERIAYVTANPVAAGLVRTPDEWPGLLVWGERRIRVQRPTAYFAAEGACPEELCLVVERPPVRTGDRGPSTGWFPRVRELIAQEIVAARDKMRSLGRSFLGRGAVLSTSFARRGRSDEEKRGVTPTFAAKLASVRAMLGAIECGFRAGHRRALVAWRKGLRDTVFPYGTWGMWVFHRALVGPPLSE
jgi:REP element-mobilizing transposase RayT